MKTAANDASPERETRGIARNGDRRVRTTAPVSLPASVEMVVRVACIMDGGRQTQREQTFPAYALSNSLHSRRSEFLLRAPPSDSKICLRALSLSPPREIPHVMPLCAQGFGTCRLAERLPVACPYLHIGQGVLGRLKVACLVVTARVQREQRPGAGCLGDARPSWLCTLCLLCHDLAWSARVCETRSSLCAETVVRNFVRA